MAEKKEWKDFSKKEKTQGCLLWIVVFLVCAIALGSCFGGEDDDATFEFTVDDYEKTIVDIVNNDKGNSFIEVQPLYKEADDLAAIPLMEDMHVLIRTNNKNNITDVSVMASSSTFMIGNREVKIAFEAIIKSVDPSLSPIQRMVIMDKLGMNWGSSMLSSTAVYDLNGISYIYQGSVEQDVIRLQIKPGK